MEVLSDVLQHTVVNKTVDYLERSSDLQSTSFGPTYQNWVPVCLTAILVICTWLANCILLGGALQTAGTGHIVPVAYFFIGSQAIAALLHVTLNLPTGVVGFLFGSTNMESFVHIYCLYSTYLDTLFCNLTFLQTFFSSLDAYLRLRNPIFYLSSARRRPALWLKVGSPWLVAALQAIGQLALSDKQQVKLHHDSEKHIPSRTRIGLHVTCVLPDPNFLIIRTAIAYALPLLTCIVLVGLQLRCLRRLRTYSTEALHSLIKVRKPFLSDSSYLQNVVNTQYSYSATNFQVGQFNVPTAVTSEIPVQHSGSDCLSQSQGRGLVSSGNGDTVSPQNLQNSLSSSWYIGQDFTTDSQTSTLQPFVPHVLLPSSAFINLNTVNAHTKPNIMYTSFHECPAHGLINMPLEEGLLTSSAVDTTEPDLEVAQLSRTDISAPTYTHPLTQSTTVAVPNHVERVPNSEILPETVTIVKTVQFPLRQATFNETVNTFGSENTRDNSSLQVEESKYNKKQTRVASPLGPATNGKQEELSSVTPLWLAAYHGEQLVVAINLVSCIIAVGTWSPYILSTLAHGLCQPIPISTGAREGNPSVLMFPELTAALDTHLPRYISRCIIQVTANRIADFRWWAYASSGLLLPCLLFFLDLGLRDGCWKSLNYGSKSNLPRRTAPTNFPMLPTNQVETYRCQNYEGGNHSRFGDNKRFHTMTPVSKALWNERRSTNSLGSSAVVVYSEIDT